MSVGLAQARPNYALCIFLTFSCTVYSDEGSDTAAETSAFCIMFLGRNFGIHSITLIINSKNLIVKTWSSVNCLSSIHNVRRCAGIITRIDYAIAIKYFIFGQAGQHFHNQGRQKQKKERLRISTFIHL